MTTRTVRRHPPDRFELLARLGRIAAEDLMLRPMLQRITDSLHRELGYELVGLVSIDAEHQRFHCEALSTALPTAAFVGQTSALGSGVVGEAASSGCTVLVSDVAQRRDSPCKLPEARSMLAVPIRFAGQTLAVLDLESTRAGVFDSAVEVIESVAVQLAGTIAAAQRLALLDRRSAMLEAIATTLRDALEAPDLVSLCDRLLRMLGVRLPLAEATILLESDIKDHLQVIAHQGASPHITFRGKLWPVAAGVVGRCFRTGETQWVQQIAGDPEYAIVNPRVQAELAVPIRFRDRVFGVINLETETPMALDHVERLAIRALADQAGGALHLGLTNQRLQETVRRLQNQDSQLESTRESLKRAVGRLKRRQRHDDPQSGLANREMLLDWLHREAVALRRGGRCAGLLLLRWPEAASFSPKEAATLIESGFDKVRGRIAQLDPHTLCAVLGGVDMVSLEHAFQIRWRSLLSQLRTPLATLLIVTAPARVHPEAWLAAAEQQAAVPVTVRSFATT